MLKDVRSLHDFSQHVEERFLAPDSLWEFYSRQYKEKQSMKHNTQPTTDEKIQIEDLWVDIGGEG